MEKMRKLILVLLAALALSSLRLNAQYPYPPGDRYNDRYYRDRYYRDRYGYDRYRYDRYRDDRYRYDRYDRYRYGRDRYYGYRGGYAYGYSPTDINNFVIAVIGNLLRHPDPKIRLQAIQAIVGGMSQVRSGTRQRNVTNIFSVQTRGGIGSSTAGAIFIPDLFALLSDPNPEVRDMASVGLDILFGTDTTLLRLMEDPDPLIRKYAAKVYIAKNLSTTRQSSQQSRERDIYELLALRTLIVHLKYEKDPEVKKVIEEAIENYVSGGEEEETTTSSSLY